VEVHQLSRPSVQLVQPPSSLMSCGALSPNLDFSRRSWPTGRPLGGELDPDPEVGLHAKLVRHAEHFLHSPSCSSTMKTWWPRRWPISASRMNSSVLVSVADDHVIGPLDDARHRLELRLAAAFEPDAVFGAELDDLLDHVPLLVDLDRIDGRVVPSYWSPQMARANAACSSPMRP
jgi:hypothetical protein